MAKIKVSGYFDTETRELVIEAARMPAQRGRKRNSEAVTAARVLADAWAAHSWTAAAPQKPQRIRDALGIRGLADDGGLRKAVKNAKARADSLFTTPHKPGDIIYGRVGAIWFSDRVTHYHTEGGKEILGFAWVWVPGRSEAVYTIAKAVLPEGKNHG